MSEKKHHPEDSHNKTPVHGGGEHKSHAPAGGKGHRESRTCGQGEHSAPATQSQPAHNAEQAGAAPSDKTADVDPVTSITAERDDLLNRLQRLSADFCNYQKRAARDVDQARQFANEELVKALVPVLDDMDRAIEAGKAAKRDENDPLVAGMKLVHDKAMEVLGRFGLTIVDQAGPFNPEIHQALMQEPSADSPPMTVLKVLQKGYQLRGRTIRPASVIVSKKPEAASEQPQNPPEKKEEPH